PHVILGTLGIISVYFLVLGLTKKNGVSLLTALLVAVGPWYVFTSRFVLQSNLSVFLLMTSMAFFFNREKKKYFLPISLFSLFLGLFSYHTTRIFFPPFLAGILVIYKKEFLELVRKRTFVNMLSGFFVILFFITSILILRNPESRTRSGLLFLVDQGAVNKIIDERAGSKFPQLITRLLYNRPVYFIEQFSKNYISYFSPQFLFLQGGTQYQFSVPEMGLLYVINLPFFYAGLVILIIKSLKDKNYRLLFLWLALSPIPASLTNERFAVIRATTMLPIPEILTSIGAFWVFSWLSKNKLKNIFRWFWFVYILILLAFLGNYMIRYFTDYRESYSWSWQYGYKQVVRYASENYAKYDKIIVSKKYGEPHEYFLFFWPWRPDKYQNDPNAIRFSQSNWYWVDRFDKFYFVNDWQIPRVSDQDFVLESGGDVGCMMSDVRCLLITSPENFPSGWKKLDTINFLDGKPAFEIYEN
ncbi:MAG: hypothetical protein AAB685_00750, partial [Patescibacteria group bacterium]